MRKKILILKKNKKELYKHKNINNKNYNNFPLQANMKANEIRSKLQHKYK